MFCPKCGKMNPDERENCSGCGAVLHEPKPETAKKNGRGKLVALIVAAAVAIGGAAAAVVSCSEETPVIAEACLIIEY